MRSRVCLVIALLATIVAAAAAQERIGWVASVDRGWQIAGREVKAGQDLSPGATLSLAPSAKVGSGEEYNIAIVFSNRQSRRYSCDSVESCRITLPRTVPPAETTLAWLTRVFNLFAEHHEQYVSVMTRDTDPVAGVVLHDAVLRLDPAGAEAMPLLAGAPAATYSVQLARQDGPALGTPSWQTASIRWNGTAGVLTPAAIVRPGLYRVRLAAADSARPREAWVVVVPPAQYGAARAAFDQASVQATTWLESIPEDEVLLLQRMFLVDLASSLR